MLAEHPEQLDEDGREILAAGEDLTRAQMIRLLEISRDIFLQQAKQVIATLVEREGRLRGTLQLIASASGEGV